MTGILPGESSPTILVQQLYFADYGSAILLPRVWSSESGPTILVRRFWSGESDTVNLLRQTFPTERPPGIFLGDSTLEMLVGRLFFGDFGPAILVRLRAFSFAGSGPGILVERLSVLQFSPSDYPW